MFLGLWKAAWVSRGLHCETSLCVTQLATGVGSEAQGLAFFQVEAAPAQDFP